MKLLLILSFFINIGLVFSNDVYYCSDTKSVGFNVDQGYEVGMFQENRFKAVIDFQNRKFISDKLNFLKSITICSFSDFTKNLHCLSAVGGSISINQNSLKYARSSHNVHDGNFNEDYTVSYGNCEIF